MGTYPATGGKPNFIPFVSPIGLISRLYHDAPRLKTDFNNKQPVMDKDGIQEAHYIASLVWPKSLLDAELNPEIPGTPGLVPMRRLAYQAQCEAWPDSLDPAKANWIVLQPFLWDGDNPEHNTERKEFLFNHVWLNVKQKAKPRRGADGKITYEGTPGLLGAYGEEIASHDIWAGCTGRVSGILWGTEFAGKKFISVRLNNIQKFREGERMGGTERPDAKSQFDPLLAAPANIVAGAGAVGGLPGVGGAQPGGLAGIKL